MLEGMSRKDINQTAFSIVQQATGETGKPPAKTDKRAAGGLVRAKNQSKDERIDLARLAATARWKRKI